MTIKKTALLTEVEAELWQLVLDGTPPALDGGEKAAKLIARLYPDVTPGKTVEVTAEQFALLVEYRKAGGRPGSDALICTVGKSTFGRAATGNKL